MAFAAHRAGRWENIQRRKTSGISDIFCDAAATSTILDEDFFDKQSFMNTDQSLRKHLIELLDGGHAHAAFDDVVADFPAKFYGEVPKGLPHSSWMLIEHMRITQQDILDFSRNPNYKAMKWPDAYWPKKPAPPSPTAWDASIKSFREDLEAMKKLVNDPKVDLFAQIEWGEGQTILREAMLVADHTAHHLGQLIDVRRLLGIWK